LLVTEWFFVGTSVLAKSTREPLWKKKGVKRKKRRVNRKKIITLWGELNFIGEQGVLEQKNPKTREDAGKKKIMSKIQPSFEGFTVK